MLQTRVFQPRLRDFHAVNGYLPPRGALRALELGWQRLVPCVSNLRRSAVCAIGGDAISGSAPRPSGTGGLQTLCWREQDSNPRSPVRTSQEKARWILSHRRIAKPRTTTDPRRGRRIRTPRLPATGSSVFRGRGRRSGRLGLARPSNNHANIARSTGYSAPLCPVNLRMTRRTQVSQLKRAYWTEPHEFSSGQER